LLPIAAEISLWLAVGTRVLVGLGEGVCFPSMHAMLSRWAPPHERSRLASIVYSGCYFGTVIAFPTSTALADSEFGWAGIFYVFGGAAIAWVMLWVVIVSSSPATHSSISEEERRYIIDSLPPASSLSFRDIPWAKVAVCLPFWALLINHTASNWAFYTLLTWLPTYMKEVLNFDVHNAGFIAVLPYIALTVTVLVAGFVADLFIERKWLSTTAVRKICQGLGFSIAGGGLVAVGYATSVPLAVALMTIAGGAVGFTNSGFQVNHLDIAPNYAGILMGITNCVATIPGIVSPYLTGIILGDDQHDIERWRIVFFISAGVYAFGLVIWLLFASGKKQL
jgi:MFS family permease